FAEHQKWMTSRWSQARSRISAIESWRAKELKISGAHNKTLLYPLADLTFSMLTLCFRIIRFTFSLVLNDREPCRILNQLLQCSSAKCSKTCGVLFATSSSVTISSQTI